MQTKTISSREIKKSSVKRILRAVRHLMVLICISIPVVLPGVAIASGFKCAAVPPSQLYWPPGTKLAVYGAAFQMEVPKHTS